MEIISIFSGIDCLGLGFSPYFDLLVAIEKEKNACLTIETNRQYHPHVEVFAKDIYSIKSKDIALLEGMTGLIGGPPCQPFSPAKSKFDPTDARIQGLSEYVRWVQYVKPSFFLFENTSGLLQASKKLLFEHFTDHLEALGYDLFYQVLNAHDYGSVQNRKRVILIGFKKQLHISYTFPEPLAQKRYVRDILKDEPLGECFNYPPKRKDIISYVPEGGNWRDLPTEALKQLALGGNYDKREGGMTGVYKRLHRDHYCPTLTTTPLQRNTMACHPIEDRPLSINESKRAQGIPDDYVLIGSTAEKYKYIGNGVPVELANCLAKSIYNYLNVL